MDKKYMMASERTGAPHARQGTKLRDMLMAEKPTPSYADFHHQITGTNVEKTCPKSLEKPRGQGAARKATMEDEMVRYMSNLPSFLENGGRTVHEKTFNVGVLDWGRLEKWRYHQKQVPTKDIGHSPSGSSTSFFSTDGSSTTHSSGGRSCSPSCPIMPRSSLQSHLDASPCKNNNQDIKSYFTKGYSTSPARQRSQRRLMPESYYPKVYPGECNARRVDLFGARTGKLQEPPAALKREQKLLGADQHLRITEEELRLDRCQIKESVSNSSAEMGKPKTSVEHVESHQERRMQTQDGHTRKEVVRQHAPNTRYLVRQQDPNNTYLVRQQDPNNREVVKRQGPNNVKRQQDPNHREVMRQQDRSTRESLQRKKTVVVLFPKDSSQYSSAKVKNDVKQTDSESRKLSGRGWGSSSDIPYSCPLPSRDDCIGESCSASIAGSNVPPQPLCVLPHSDRMSYSPSRSKIIIEEKKLAMLPKSTSTAKSSADLDMRRGSQSTTRGSTSPFRSKIIEEKPAMLPKSTSTVKSSAHLDMRSGSESTTRGRSSSPIKRLSQGMGKIIRNVGSRDNSPLRRSCSKDAPAKSMSERANVCSKSDFSCVDKPIANDRSRSSPLRRLLDPLFKPKASSNHQVTDPFRRDSASTPERCSRSAKVQSKLTSGKTASYGDSQHRNKSSTQALFQVAFKNGHPLFTFAVDNNSEILAATSKRSSSLEKNHISWTYTFFTVREMKKKNGLWIHQGSKATAPGYVPNAVAQMKVSDPQYGYTDHECTREFTLFAVDVEHVDQRAAEIHPTNELAAIVIRKPKVNPKDEHPDNTCVSEACNHTRESLLEWNKPPVNCSDSLSTTVILPGGVHTVPSKGAVSTLTQRWKSGGSCDCGGWDLGCQLQIYTNRNKSDKKMFPSETSGPSGAEFKLFSQASDEGHPTLSLKPFKERIHSVEFNSSLSLLQAFALCVAVLDCRIPSTGLLEPSSIRLPSRVVASEEAPARYVSCPPPHSPVSRV